VQTTTRGTSGVVNFNAGAVSKPAPKLSKKTLNILTYKERLEYFDLQRKTVNILSNENNQQGQTSAPAPTELVLATKTGLPARLNVAPEGLTLAVADFHDSLLASIGKTGLPDLPRCTLEPLGWRQPDIEGGETIYAPDLAITILAALDVFRYFDKPFSKGATGTGPTCYSINQRTGNGMPGDNCPSCPLRQFDEKGRAPACREYRLLFGMRPSDGMVLQVDLPPTSKRSSTEHLRRMLALRVPSYREVTMVGFETSKGYPRATFARGLRLDAEQEQLAKAFSQVLRSFLDPIKSGSTPHTESEVA
jgi:hypothetical protein